tara:strand:+ start:5480 stop:6358 length:879 start_codon:yes stop_codon:yes gene_type:complete
MFKKISALIKEGKSNDNDVKNVGDETPAEEMEVKGDMMDEAKDQKDDGGEMWKSPTFEAPEVGYNEEKNLSIAKSMKSDSYDEWQPKNDPWTYSAKFGEGDRIEDVVFYATSPEGKRVKVTQESNPKAFNSIAQTNPEIMKMMEEGGADEAGELGESQQAPMEMGESQQAPMEMGESQQAPMEMGESQQAPMEMGESQQAPMEFGESSTEMGESQQAPREFGESFQSLGDLATALDGKSPQEVQKWMQANPGAAAQYLAQIASAAGGKAGARAAGNRADVSVTGKAASGGKL